MAKAESPAKLKQWTKELYERFCSVSSMHGYTELYSAKTLFFKWFWISIILGSIIITGYQVNQAVYQYMYQSTYTNIAPATEDQVIYPPVKICMPHWIMWINYSKADEYFSRNATHYSLSYLTDIYSTQAFDIEKARKEFLTGFAKYNFTNIFDYYEQIALAPYTWIYFEPNTNEGNVLKNNNKDYISEIFHIDWFNAQSEHPVLCYSINGSNVKKHLSEGYRKISPYETAKNKIHLYLDPLIENQIKYFIWDDKYLDNNQKYIEVWQNEAGYVVRKGTGNTLPYMLVIDGYSEEYGSVSVDQQVATFKVQASANVWISSAEKPCVDEKFITSNKTCQQKCSIENYVENIHNIKFCYFKHGCSMLLQSFYGKSNKNNDMPKLCRNLINFFGKEEEDWLEEDHDDFGLGQSDERLEPFKARKNDSEKSLAECLQNCTSSYCENWKFEIPKSILIDNLLPTDDSRLENVDLQVVIEYPAIGQILVLTETNSQTWENFVSNIGGLLGIWTGASILSFIQLFYLCCCAAIDEAYTPKWLRLGRIKGDITPKHKIERPLTVVVKRRTRSNSK